MTLRICSTLGGRKEPFEPIDSPVRMYVCGMTPKFHPHVGHARFSVTADVLRRYLEYRGYAVKFVQNFTDIDDKIIERAAREGRTPQEVAQAYTDSYFHLLDKLNVRRADVYPTVTGSMNAIVEYVRGLVERGYGYVADGDVYFEVGKFEPYGQLSGRTDEGQFIGARKDVEPGKRDPRDFALWKRAKPGEPAWPSPWGDGRPGWHIECSAMVRETLGNQIDIHGGGRDLIFPHHENELAQSEAFTDARPFVRFWAHNGLVMAGSEKMAHSLENFTTVQEVLERYDPMALRYFLLQTHYRMPITYNPEVLPSAERALARLRGALEGFSAEGARAEPLPYVDEARAAFEQAMDDDFNTPAALAALFDLAREINRHRDAGGAAADVAAGQSVLLELAGVLGFELTARAAEGPGGDAEPFIELLLQTRERLREAKQWALADEIRNGLRELGIVVEDRPDGAVWRRESR
jgi:cysteinyl-tRNA synthetase